MKAVFDDSGAAYNPKRDGPLDSYLEKHRGITSFPLFKGYKHYKMLWDKGYLEPGVSVVRIMWNVGRGDAHFGVLGQFELEGVENAHHGGEPGKHDPRKLLARNCPPWEALHLARTPISRLVDKKYFVFEYYHDKEHSALVLFESDLKRMRCAPGFKLIDPEEHRQEVFTERCLDELARLGVKEVFSARCKNAMRDDFLGFTLHYSEGERKPFFHYDFVDPKDWGERFKERGIELKEFER